MINKYKVTTAFTIESREMTHVGGNTKQVKVADRSLEVLLDSLQKEGVDVDRDNSGILFNEEGKTVFEIIFGNNNLFNSLC